MTHDRREADRLARSAQGADRVTEIALSLALIVRLGEALAGECPCRRSRSRSRAQMGCRRSVPRASTRRTGARPGAAAPRRVSRRSRSPFGSTTTAPSRCATARAAIPAWVNVLPEPVVPTTSVCAPPPGPANGIRTDARRPLFPTSRRPASTAAPRRAATRRRRRARRGSARSAPPRSGPGRRRWRRRRGASGARAGRR